MERAKARSQNGGGIMGEYRKKYDEDFKKNAVKLSYAGPKSVKGIADDLGIHENLLYNW
jgi:transposase